MAKLTIERFAPSQHEVDDWLELFDFQLLAAGIDPTTDDAKTKAIFLTHIAQEAYGVLKNLHDVALSDASIKFATLRDEFQAHYKVAVNQYVAKSTFASTKQRPNEGAQVYATRLRAAATHCKFGKEADVRLREQFVVGLADLELKLKIYNKKSLDTFAKMVSFVVDRERLIEQFQGAKVDTGEAAAVHAINTSHQSSNSATNNNFNTNRANTSRSQQQQPQANSATGSKCYRCGKSHPQQQCKFAKSTCYHCGKQGHLKTVCRSKQRGEPAQYKPAVRQIAAEDTQGTDHQENTEGYENDYQQSTSPDRRLYTIRLVDTHTKSTPTLKVQVALQGKSTTMDLDTGAAESVMALETFTQLGLSKQHLKPSAVQLRSYSGNIIPLEGVARLPVTFGTQTKVLPLYVITSPTESLCGMSWISAFGTKEVLVKAATESPHRQINSINTQELFNTFAELFTPRHRGHAMKVPPTDLFLKPDAPPRYVKARPVPLALQQQLKEELQRLQDEGSIEPVSYSRWASPVVVVRKASGALRLCGDYKVSVNPTLETVEYALPKVSDIFAKLNGSTVFSTLDLASAYNQLSLTEEARQLTTINTPYGLFRYTTLPFGIATAPALFQRVIDTVLADLPRTFGYLDDIIVGGTDVEDHWKNLTLVLNRLLEFGIKLNKAKCNLECSEVEYLGHRLSGDGLRPCEDKLQSIQHAPAPTDQKSLRGFTGLINYYGSFIPNLATMLAPLYELLKKDKKWSWSTKEQQAFDQAKRALSSQSCLCTYSPELPLTLTCDASEVGVGAILAHRYPDGKERPIAFASKKLSQAEKGYAQIEKEGLGIIFGLRKFHTYLFGRPFLLKTDHRPLIHIFSPTQGIPKHSLSRLNRWALLLAEYQYQIAYVPTDKMAADFFSRHPTQAPEDEPGEMDKAINAVLVEQANLMNLSVQALERATRADATLTQVLHYLVAGWPLNLQQQPEEIRQFHALRSGLMSHRGILMYGPRVVIPTAMRKAVLEELHRTHQGAQRSKANARQYFFWPSVTADIEEMVRRCDACQRWVANTPETLVTPTDWPKEPWQQLHIDICGPIEGNLVLVTVDQSTKWVDAAVMARVDSANIIRHLRQLFATFGLPRTLISDNASYFVSDEMATFCKSNGIRHTTSSPYHPRSNGLAERAIQALKLAIHKMRQQHTDYFCDLLAFYLCDQHSTPHCVTGVAPAELMFGRRTRTRLDNIIPRDDDRVFRAQERQAGGRELPLFNVGDAVYVRDFPRGRGQPNYIPATVLQRAAPYSYRLQLGDHSIIYRHADHIRRRTLPEADGIASAAALPRLRCDPGAEVTIQRPPPASGEGARPSANMSFTNTSMHQLPHSTPRATPPAGSHTSMREHSLLQQQRRATMQETIREDSEHLIPPSPPRPLLRAPPSSQSTPRVSTDGPRHRTVSPSVAPATPRGALAPPHRHNVDLDGSPVARPRPGRQMQLHPAVLRPPLSRHPMTLRSQGPSPASSADVSRDL